MRGPQTITARPRRRGATSCANPTADQDGYAARIWARRPYAVWIYGMVSLPDDEPS